MGTIEDSLATWWRRDDEGIARMANEEERKSGGCGCGGCGCGGGGNKKGREGQPVDDEGRTNLGLRGTN